MTIPSSGLPQEELYLQVEDVNCNTSVHTAKAGYLKAINVNAGPDRQFAAGLATFTATITGFTALNDDVVFVWDFGDGTSMTGVLSPTGQSTVPVTVNPDGSATFTVTHMYSGTPVPSMATVRIDDGLGGTGSDDVLFGVECDPDKWGDHGGGDTGHGQDDDDDLDCDGFPTKPRTGGRGSEEFIGTDATDPCPDDEADAAWPPDFNNSGGVSLSDVVGFGQHYNKSSQQQGYSQRFDLNASGGINLSDIVVLGPFFNRDCEPG
jgi:hypothetical protein